MNLKIEKNLILLDRLGTHREELLNSNKIDNGNIINLPSIDHNLTYCYLYSDIINFFENSDEEENIKILSQNNENTWSKFLEKDETMIFALILNTKVGLLLEKVTNPLKNLENEINESHNFKILADCAGELFILLNYWLTNACKESFLKVSIEKFVLQDLQPILKIIFYLDKINKIKLTYIKDFDIFKVLIQKIAIENLVWGVDSTEINKNISKENNIDYNELFIRSFSNLVFLSIRYIEDLKEEVKNNFDQSIITGDHKPHMGLLLCFLKLLDSAGKSFNTIPNRLKKFYYTDILKMSNKKIVPDSAYINFKLKAQTKPIPLEKGTKIFGGKNDKGRDILFQTNSKCNISNLQLKKLYIVKNDINARLRKEKKINDSIEIDEYSNSDISLQKPLEKSIKRDYKAGIVIENKIFYLDSGDRYIYVHFHLTKEGFQETLKKFQILQEQNVISGAINKIIRDSLIIEYSAKNKWQVIDNWMASTSKDKENTITIALFINRTKPPVDFDEKINMERENYKIFSPALRFSLNVNNYYENVSVFEFFNIEQVSIDVEVSNYKNIALQDDYGNIDLKKSFTPFGSTPKINNSLYINCENILAIHPTNLSLDIEWADLPEDNGGFEKHYAGYSQAIKNSDFKAEVKLMYNEKWINITTENDLINLFETKKNENEIEKLIPNKKISLELKSILNNDDGLNFFDKKKNTGQLKISLVSPNIAFGHSDYNEIKKKTIIDSVKNKFKIENEELKTPYTPTISSISANYTAYTSIILNKKKIVKPDFYEGDVKHILPFGYWSYLFNESKSTEISLLTRDSNLGSLFYENTLDVYLGFEKSISTFVSIHVELKNTTTLEVTNFRSLKIQVMEKNRWISTDFVKIISDTTISFSQSGIIEIEIKKGLAIENTIMQDSLFWIRIYNNDSAILNIPNIKGVYINAVKVERVLNEDNDDVKLLSSGTLSKLYDKNIPEIVEISQPFASSGFYAEESEQIFSKRISNRLSHKNRPLSILDYEKIILENFEDVLLVKCVNNCSKNKCNTNAPGYITIVVVPKNIASKFNSIALFSIQNFLEEISSPHIQIEVVNPVYEKIKIFADIKLKDNYISEHIISDLKEEFYKKLRFDVKDDDGLFRLGTAFYPSNLYRSILKKKEVEYVNNFRLIKYYEIHGKKYLQNIKSLEEKILPTLPWSYLTSSEEHVISLSDNNISDSIEKHIGIGTMSIEKDFTIGPWETSLNAVLSVEKSEIKRSNGENFITFKIKK